ncbi:MAG: magnesium-protoporphyrin IX monomethyl ester (oxidative) cyclase [Paracoccaceae bacterium]
MNAHADMNVDENAAGILPHNSEEATAIATETTLLDPRFYTTDFDEMDRIDVTPVRKEWDEMIAKMAADPNRGHFKKNENWTTPDWENMDPKLKAELIDFLVSSLTAEFSGCVLYKEMKRRGNNPDICQLFQLMARDEARHAGFINDALREAGVAVNLGFLTKAKKYTYFRPKFIYYATYLSEKIGYARYITIYRHLEKNPDNMIHPIFQWFEQWCNDEFSHGEAFALLMKTDPKLTQSWNNKLWIRFFLVAVFSVMCIRDHLRPEFHKALGIDVDWYDREVLRKTSEISKQIFPIELDLDNPRWERNLLKLREASAAMDAAKRRGGIAGALGKFSAGARAGLAFASLYLIPVKKNDVPEDGRLVPSY